MSVQLLEYYNDSVSDDDDEKCGKNSNDEGSTRALAEKRRYFNNKRVLPVGTYQRHSKSLREFSEVFSFAERVDTNHTSVSKSFHLRKSSSLLYELPEPQRWVKHSDAKKPFYENYSAKDSASDVQTQKCFSLLNANSSVNVEINEMFSNCEKNSLHPDDDGDDNESEITVKDDIKTLFSLPERSQDSLQPSDAEQFSILMQASLHGEPQKKDLISPLNNVYFQTSSSGDAVQNVIEDEFHSFHDSPKADFINENPKASIPKGREWHGYFLSEKDYFTAPSHGVAPKLFVVNSRDLINSEWREAFSRGDGRLKPKSHPTAGVTSFNVTLAPSRRQRQKNQINFLAQEVANKEHEFSERASQQRYSKYQTQMKYGW